MNLLRSPQLVIPVLILTGLFVFDKIFLIPGVRDSFMQPGGMVYYRHRKGLVEQLQKHMQSPQARQKQNVIVFGDSRSFGIGTGMAASAGRNDVTIWNFAGPQAVPAYHYYLTNKIFIQTVRPSAVLIGISPDALNRNAGIFSSPVLNYGTGQDFYEDHITMVPEFDRERYIQTRRFAITGMQFSLRTLIRRTQGSLTGAGSEKISPELMASLSQEQKTMAMSLARASSETLGNYSYENSDQIKVLNMTRGAQYAWVGRMSDAELKKETEQLVNLYLESFRPSAEQMYFFEKTLQILQKSGVKVVVFRPKVNPHLREVYRSEPKIAVLWTRIQYLSRLYGARTIDLNEAIECNDYYDASHMSVTCYPEITGKLLDRL